MFYRVDIAQTYVTNQFQSTLYYANESLVAENIMWRLKGADELAERVAAEIIPRWRKVVNPGVTFDFIRVTPFDDDFRLQMPQPFEKRLGLQGQNNAGDWLPIEQGIIIRFNLSPVNKFQLVKQPRRSHIFLSGMSEGNWDVGTLNASFLDEAFPGTYRHDLRQLCKALSKDLGDTILPDFVDGGVFKPCRVRWQKIATIPVPGQGARNDVVWKIIGYSEVTGAEYKTRLAYNRNRVKN